MIAFLQVWLFGVDLRLGHGIGIYTVIEALIFLTALTLMRSTSPKMHLAGVIAFYAIFLASMALSTTGLMP